MKSKIFLRVTLLKKKEHSYKRNKNQVETKMRKEQINT